MSNHLVSQQFEFPGGQMAHVDNLPMDASAANLQRRTVGHMSRSPALLNYAVSNGQAGSMERISNNSSFQNVMASKNQTGRTELEAGNSGFVASEVTPNNLGPQKAFLLSKRKADMEAAANYISQHSMPNKRTVQQLGTSPRFSQILQPSSPNNKSTQMQSKIDPSIMQNVLVSNKRMVRNESISSRSGSQRVQTPKGRTAQNGPVSKVQSGSAGAVRSKMSEQLAAALALVSENQDKTVGSENDDVISNTQIATDSQSRPGSVLNSNGAQQLGIQDSNKSVFGGESSSADKPDGTIGFSAKLPTNVYIGDPIILPDEDVSFSDNFFVKDDLLQGNGLSWALDHGMPLTEEKEKIVVEKADIVDEGGGNISDKGKLSPEYLATEIEAELYKLFGGVNKKYKEKGRSLLFNLKDRANPELRERVVSGEITPERLCSMTAEELASKELTEWRMAKAEELAQMVVLQDTDVDMRRLVKKTHKGEYQVEVEENDDIMVEVSVVPSEAAQTQSKSKKIEAQSPELEDVKDKGKIASQKKSSENQDLPGSLVIPSDGTDLMQGMIVDELKDAEFLPPIISLDEFMESLNSEPPFENLQGDTGQSTMSSVKENTDAVNDAAGSASASKEHTNSPDKTDEVVMKQSISEAVKPPRESPVKQNVSPRANSSTVQHIWEGALQLSLSSSIKAFGVFRSGEKTSIAEWSSSLEIKGRVRLDAFEKFVKDLPNSRSRAVMVIHFVLKDNSDESERASLHEAIESYVTDNRLGFAEPATGVELYLCPTRGRVVDMLSNYVSKDRTDIFNSSDNGLIGVIVWRKAHLKTSTISPNSASHQKHSTSTNSSGSSSLKRQHNTSSRRQQEVDANNVNVNMMNKAPHPPPPPPPPPPPANAVTQPPHDDDDSDIPPGFGPPGAARDDDDLPEFNFAGNVNHPTRSSMLNAQQGSRTAVPNPGPTRPVNQLRELIHKYGQTGAINDSGRSRSWVGNSRDSAVGLGIEPWNDDDDDDDMPEWRPQSHQQQTLAHSLQPLQPPRGGRHVVAQPQHLNPAMTQAAVNIVNESGPAAWHQGARWAAQPPTGGQYYGSRSSRGY